jgi:hypothetical protein
MRQLILLALTSLALFPPSRTCAAESPRIKERAAKKACATGDFRQGVTILADLYVDTNDVTYVFNQGRCYEQNHQWVSAIDRFREYLRKIANAPAADKAEAEKHIADCEALRAQEEPQPVPAPSPSAPMPIAIPAADPTPARESAVVGQRATSKGDRGSALRATGIAIGSAGLATTVAGLVLNLKANSLADEFNRTQKPATRSSQSSYKTGSMICYGAGAGVLASGVVLYVIGRSAGTDETTRISFLPVLMPTGFSLNARGAF